MKPEGTLFILSGPSGVGKGTLKKMLLEEFPETVAFSVSATTRAPREGERDGVDYFFITQEAFERRIAEEDFLEYARFSENYYGTPRSWVQQLLSDSTDVLLEIEVQGAQQVMQRAPDAVSVFILPPSVEELAKRLRGRGTESEDVVLRRLSNAERELSCAPLYQYQIVNDNLQKAYAALREIYIKHSVISKL